ncbi:hypothetical protein TSTA_110500 [Talaromyces stipitatus ATCC 10500]|uniref:Uncharacterized protein n=1 Tax=Talaromyces stipitatus (strain ATCC 10500 / CBS 375.48 / QM 6759 / NRRL 1006) TaxID=441959 RepID=B8MUV0_TALSN|nr:uncharacterized protein TSTA_110500 [Talaromyces stipitatus ATCC 10500]EED11870.1 hypothetical protein TSTA_110500 [Talaromyces stipitatus ATCC 10500]
MASQQRSVAHMTANMGASESRISNSDVRKCIDAIEDELLSGDYSDGVTPDSAIMCLRTIYSAAEKGGGSVITSPRPAGHPDDPDRDPDRDPDHGGSWVVSPYPDPP